MRNILLILLVITLVSCSSDWVCCSNKIQIGMTKEDVLEKCGGPSNVSSVTNSLGVTDVWTYYYWDIWIGYQKDVGSCSVCFFDGRVISYRK